MKVRVSTKAIIVHEGKLLALQHQNKEGPYFTLPGGGQEHGESLDLCVIRECMEEVGADVTVGKVAFVRDYIAKNHEFASQDTNHHHQMEVVFHCSLKAPYVLKPALVMDKSQTGVAWLPMEQLEKVSFWPRCFVGAILRFDRERGGVDYLGDKN
jgi:ADP-ribose pyrophosphatase YjhB (NUDIX family)